MSWGNIVGINGGIWTVDRPALTSQHTWYLSFILHRQHFQISNFTPKNWLKTPQSTKKCPWKVKYMQFLYSIWKSLHLPEYFYTGMVPVTIIRLSENIFKIVFAGRETQLRWPSLNHQCTSMWSEAVDIYFIILTPKICYAFMRVLLKMNNNK